MLDSRKEERKKEGNRVTIELLQADTAPPKDKVSFAITDDISFRGIKILSQAMFPVNSRLKIGLFLGAIRKKIDITGRVRWANRLDDEMYEIGVELETSKASRDDLQTLIDHLYRD
jgi:hypothetical protein